MSDRPCPTTTRAAIPRHTGSTVPLRCLSAQTAVAPPLSPWFRSDTAMIAVVPSFIAVDLLPPSHRRRGATAVLVRHKPQLHRHGRSGSAVVPSLIAVAPRITVNIADRRGGTAETLNMYKTSAVLPRVEPMSVGSPRHRHYRRGTALTAAAPP